MQFKTTDGSKTISVTMYNVDSQMRCQADITIVETGTQVKGLTVIPSDNGGVSVYMPNEMRTTWNVTEVSWAYVRRIVTGMYKEQYGRQMKSQIHKKNVCHFYDIQKNEQAQADVIIKKEDTSEIFFSIIVTHYEDDHFDVFRSNESGDTYHIGAPEWKELCKVAIHEYRRQILGNDLQPAENVEVIFTQPSRVYVCSMDLKLPEMKKAVCGFRIRYTYENGSVIVSLPSYIKLWKNDKISWKSLCELISNEVRNNIGIEQTVNADTSAFPVADNPQQPSESKKLLRKSEAAFSSFAFYPQSVMRNVEDKTVKKKGLYDIAYAMSLGSRAGIGPFEINLLEWIERLQFSTSTMLVDLINAGYVSFGWRNGIGRKQLTNILNRMYSYDLIRISHFVSVDDKGDPVNDSHSMRIYTVGQNGSVLLHELEHKCRRFNPFEVFHDANTVRRNLSSNQWLIFFLCNYSEKIGEDYQTSRIVYCKGVDFIGARIYASVTLCGHTLIADAIRRTEDFEVESHLEWLKHKMNRFVQMFDNLEQLYCGLEQVYYPSRPIIVLLFEDDAHINEMWSKIRTALPVDGRQEVWLTTDLRTFNNSYSGERFLVEKDGDFVPVDLLKLFGKESGASVFQETGESAITELPDENDISEESVYPDKKLQPKTPAIV